MIYSGGVNSGAYTRYTAPQPQRPAYTRYTAPQPQRPVYPHPASGQDVLLKKPKFIRQNESQANNYLLSDGGALYEKAEAYTKYSPSAVHVSTEPVKSGKALKADDKLLVEQKSMMEYQPTDQVIETNYHVAGKQKLSEADRILSDAKKRREIESAAKYAEPPSNPYQDMLPYVLAASGGGALTGLVIKNLMLTLGSVAVGAGALYFSGKMNPPEPAGGGKQNIRNKLSAIS